MNDVDREAIAEEAVARSHDTRSRVVILVCAIITVAAVAFAGFVLVRDRQASDDQAAVSEDRADAADARTDKVVDDTEPVMDRILRICASDERTDLPDGLCLAALDAKETVAQAEPIVGEQGAEGEEGPRGPPGPRGPRGPSGEDADPPSSAELGQAVRRYCAIVDCEGPTAAEVQAAVALFCDANGECAGPPGAEGEEGPQGPAGPPPSDAQVLAAVVAYCDSHDGCRGPQGPPGDTGPQGPPGEPGQPGRDAFPFTFRFTVPADGPLDEPHTYTCRITSPDADVTCEEET